MPFLNPSFKMLAQQRKNWCWAAVSTGIRRFSRPRTSPAQCETAKEVLKGPDCCGSPATCDFEFSLRKALESIGRLQQFFDGQVTFDVIEREITKFNRPVCARIVWDGDGLANGAHFVVIHGCERRAGVPYVWVKDPDSGAPLATRVTKPSEANSADMPFSLFARQYKSKGTWRQTYLVE